MKLEGISAEVTQDDRILAALAHASVILPFWGLIGAIVVWVTQREKSRFVSFQALQGTIYQFIPILTGFAGFACYMCSFLGMFLLIPMSGTEPGAVDNVLATIATIFPFCVLGLFMLVGFAFVLYGLYGAVCVLRGNDFRYALIGPWLERYLNREKVVT
ncbi:MAG: DUF4870 domain-containing protein [Chloroflexota bacterium]|nr:DUF4870 domain-containing protein [Chloroflexota bacterium]